MRAIIISRFIYKRHIISALIELIKKIEISNVDKEKIYSNAFHFFLLLIFELFYLH